MDELLQPRTDAGVLAQVLVVLVLWVAGIAWSWKRGPDARRLAFAVGFFTLGLFALRAMH